MGYQGFLWFEAVPCIAHCWMPQDDTFFFFFFFLSAAACLLSNQWSGLQTEWFCVPLWAVLPFCGHRAGWWCVGVGVCTSHLGKVQGITTAPEKSSALLPAWRHWKKKQHLIKLKGRQFKTNANETPLHAVKLPWRTLCHRKMFLKPKRNSEMEKKDG